MREQELQYSILQYLRYQGHFVWKQNNAGIKKADGSYIPSNLKGIADIIGVLKGGRFIAVECKVGRNKPTLYQKEFLAQVKQAGGLAFVAYSLDDVIREVKNGD